MSPGSRHRRAGIVAPGCRLRSSRALPPLRTLPLPDPVPLLGRMPLRGAVSLRGTVSPWGTVSLRGTVSPWGAVSLLLTALLLCALIALATSPAPAAAAYPPRITFTGTLPPGWTLEEMPSDRPEYVGFRASKEIRDSSGLQLAWANVESLHQWWQNFDSADAYVAWIQSPDGGGAQYQYTTGFVTIDGARFGYSSSDSEDAIGRQYYYPLPDGSSIWINVGADYPMSDPSLSAEEAQLIAETEQVFAGFRYDFTPWTTDATAGPGGQPPATGGLPWQTVAAGAAAVAAAAAAIAGSAASARGRRRKQDPNEEVGYILELSSERLHLSASQPVGLMVTVWRVLASGRVESAPNAQISLVAPPGVTAEPAAGAGRLHTGVRQDAPPVAGAALLVRAATAKGATQARVEVVGEGASELVLTVEPAGAALKPTGRDVIMVAAHLKLSLTAQMDPALNFESARASIAFETPTSADWLDIGAPRDTADGKDLPVSVSPPDPTSPGTPPETVTVRATATVGSETLRGSVVIPIQRPPAIDARPDTVETAAGSAEQTEVMVWIEEPGDLEWQFEARWHENHRPLARFALHPETASSALLTLTENAASLPDNGLAEEASTLIVTGTAEGWDPLERYVKVIVAREGLFIDAIGRDRDGTFHIEARGEGRPTEIDVRVYVRQESGGIALDPELSQTVEWTPGGDERSPGNAVLAMSEFSCAFAGMRPSNTPSATYRLRLGRRLPTGPDPVPGLLQASVPGRDEPTFTAQVPLRFLGVDTSPYTALWKEEYQNCMQVINDFAPLDLQPRFRALVNEQGIRMGAEGLHEMRRRIWSISENALRKEAEDYLTTAWYIEQIEGVLDWVSYCGDIAFAVASGRIVGTAGGIALGLLKPVLVSAITAYRDDRSLEWWAKEQVKLAVMVAEGQWTDPDFIQKITGAGRAKVWAAFIAYTFIKNWAMDPEHRITEAMLNTLRMIRDQALISFLRTVAGTSPVPVPKPGTPAAAGAPQAKPAPPPVAKAPTTSPGTAKPTAKPAPAVAPKATTEPGAGKPKPEADIPPEAPPPKKQPPAPDDVEAPPTKTPGPSPGRRTIPHVGDSHADATKSIAAAQKGNRKEVGAIVKDGKVVHTQEGTTTEVDWPRELLDGADTIHSHPPQTENVTLKIKGRPDLDVGEITRPGTAPSAEDIGHAIEFNQKSTTVIGENAQGRQTAYTVKLKNEAIDQSPLSRTELSGRIMEKHKAIVKQLNKDIDQEIATAVRFGGNRDMVKQLVQKKANLQRQFSEQALAQVAADPEFSGYIDVEMAPAP